MRYNLHDMNVESVAALLGCDPGDGLVNRMNDLHRRGIVHDDMRMGEYHHAVLLDMLACSFRRAFSDAMENRS